MAEPSSQLNKISDSKNESQESFNNLPQKSNVDKKAEEISEVSVGQVAKGTPKPEIKKWIWINNNFQKNI